MADKHNVNIPAVTNAIAEDVADIKENLEFHKDCFEKVCTGWSNTSVTNLGAISSIWVPTSAMVPTTTNGAAAGIVEKATNDIMYSYYAFSSTTEQYVSFNIVMSESWNVGTIKAKFFWSSATGSTANDTVEWEMAAIAISNSDALDVAVGTSQVITDTLLSNDGAELQVSDATPALTVGGTPTLADIIHYKISRNVAGTDDMTEDAWLFGVLIQFTENVSVSAW